MFRGRCSAPSAPGQEWPENEDSNPESGSEEDVAEEAEDTPENPTSAEKRARHKRVERNRRNEINARYKILHDKLPSIAGDTASQGRIVTETRKFVQKMRDLVAQNDTMLERKRKQNADMELDIRALEKKYRKLRAKRAAKERARALRAGSRGAAEGLSVANYRLYRYPMHWP